jgi:hypothetical protein
MYWLTSGMCYPGEIGWDQRHSDLLVKILDKLVFGCASVDVNAERERYAIGIKLRPSIPANLLSNAANDELIEAHALTIGRICGVPMQPFRKRAAAATWLQKTMRATRLPFLKLAQSKRLRQRGDSL